MDSKKDQLFRRMDQRQEDRLNQKSAFLSEKEANQAQHQQRLQEVDNQAQEIKDYINSIAGKNLDPKGDFMAITEALDDVTRRLQALDQHFKENTEAMAKYDVERAQKVLAQVRTDYLKLQDALQPKKKFGFKSKSKTSSKPAETPKAESAAPSLTPLTGEDGYRVQNPEGKAVVDVLATDVEGRDVVVRNLRNCEVRLFGVPSTVHVTDLTNVTLLSGPVQTSVFIENCQDCTFVLACQQLRTHASKNSRFYLKVTSKGIIEDCNDVWFAPYNLDYPELAKHMEKSGLDPHVNNWNKIDDFNWLSSSKQSPHWSILPDNERLTFS